MVVQTTSLKLGFMKTLYLHKPENARSVRNQISSRNRKVTLSNSRGGQDCLKSITILSEDLTHEVSDRHDLFPGEMSYEGHSAEPQRGLHENLRHFRKRQVQRLTNCLYSPQRGQRVPYIPFPKSFSPSNMHPLKMWASLLLTHLPIACLSPEILGQPHEH